MSTYLSIKESSELTQKSTRTIRRLIESILNGDFDSLDFNEPLIKQIKRNKSQFQTTILKSFLETHFKLTLQKEEVPKSESESSMIEFLKKELEAKGTIIEKFQNQVDTFQEQFSEFQKMETQTLQFVNQIQKEKQQLLIENQKLLDTLQGKNKIVSIPSAQNIEDVESERIEKLLKNLEKNFQVSQSEQKIQN